MNDFAFFDEKTDTISSCDFELKVKITLNNQKPRNLRKHY